jgi:hypothetical protein
MGFALSLQWADEGHAGNTLPTKVPNACRNCDSKSEYHFGATCFQSKGSRFEFLRGRGGMDGGLCR